MSMSQWNYEQEAQVIERNEEDKLGQENDKQGEVEQEKDEHGQNKWEEVKGTEQVCVAEDWQMGTHKEVKVKQVEDISLRVQPIVSQ